MAIILVIIQFLMPLVVSLVSQKLSGFPYWNKRATLLFSVIITTSTSQNIISWKTFKICNCNWLSAFESIKDILLVTDPNNFPQAWVMMPHKYLIIILLPDLKLFLSFGKEKGNWKIQQALDCDFFQRGGHIIIYRKLLCLQPVKL